MTAPKRKSLINVTEENYDRAEHIRRKIAAYKATTGAKTMLDALEEIVEKGTKD